jgi:hypothetical protein
MGLKSEFVRKAWEFEKVELWIKKPGAD